MNKALLLFTALIGLWSCGTSKINKSVYSRVPKVDVLIDSINSKHFEFNTMSAKISGKYSGDNQSFSFKGNIKIQKDSVLWLTISPGLGLELGRVLIDKDSVHFVNRFDKTYYKNSLVDLSKKVKSPLSFNNIQALLVGNLMSDIGLKKNYSYLEGQKFILCSVSYKQLKKIEKSRRKPNQEIYLASINPAKYRINSQTIKNYGLNKSLSVDYQDFEKHNDTWLGESIKLNLSANQSISLSLSYSRINFNKTLKFPFSVPDSYEIID